MAMLCRVADSLFWIGRFMERAENTARLVDVYMQIVLELAMDSEEATARHWEPILQSTGDRELFFELYPGIDRYNVAEFLTFNSQNPSSIFSCIRALRENARQIRDQISMDMWEVINRCYLELRSASVQDVWTRDPFGFYSRIKEYSQLFHGMTSATFLHREGLRFLECGKYLERADKTGRILDVKYHLLLPGQEQVGGGLDVAQWMALLRACSALEAYHQLYVSDIRPINVAEMLILSNDFPRSILFCVDHLDTAMHEISKCPRTHFSNEAERLSGRLLYDLKYTRAKDLVSEGMHECLQNIQTRLNKISLELNAAYMFFPIVDPAMESTQSAGNLSNSD